MSPVKTFVIIPRNCERSGKSVYQQTKTRSAQSTQTIEHPWGNPERIMVRLDANDGRDLTLRLQAQFDRVAPGYDIQENDLPVYHQESSASDPVLQNTHTTNAPIIPSTLIYALRFTGCPDTTAKMPRWLYIYSARHPRRDVSGETTNPAEPYDIYIPPCDV